MYIARNLAFGHHFTNMYFLAYFVFLFFFLVFLFAKFFQILWDVYKLNKTCQFSLRASQSAPDDTDKSMKESKETHKALSKYMMEGGRKGNCYKFRNK